MTLMGLSGRLESLEDGGDFCALPNWPLRGSCVAAWAEPADPSPAEIAREFGVPANQLPVCTPQSLVSRR